jgi:hypothetical protein
VSVSVDGDGHLETDASSCSGLYGKDEMCLFPAFRVFRHVDVCMEYVFVFPLIPQR